MSALLNALMADKIKPLTAAEKAEARKLKALRPRNGNSTSRRRSSASFWARRRVPFLTT